MRYVPEEHEMIKSCVALLAFAFAVNANAANITLVDAWKSLAPSQSMWVVTDSCSLPLTGCVWAATAEAKSSAADGWSLVASRVYVDIYENDASGVYSALLKRPGPDTSPVPLPAAGWLFMSALAGVGLISRKRAARK
jgi:hypothetical protein